MVPVLVGDPTLTTAFQTPHEGLLPLAALPPFLSGPNALSSGIRGLCMDFSEIIAIRGLHWRGVSCWLSLSGVTKALSLLQAFQASVSSWGRAETPELAPGSTTHSPSLGKVVTPPSSPTLLENHSSAALLMMSQERFAL